MANKKQTISGGTLDFVEEAEEMIANGKTPDIPAEITIKFSKRLVGEPFTAKSGIELVEVRIPNVDRGDKRPWETFVVSPKMIHENNFGKGVWMKLPKDRSTLISRSVRNGVDKDGKTIWERETRLVSNTELKDLLEAYKKANDK